ncbi:MAG: hypothetical protein GX303_02070 [Clostridiales bacterium]|nr:hypothetical protein [Clostridiales bacterium]
MLYPKTKEKELSSALFQNPTSEYRGAPFWSWNCRLDTEELLRQIDVFKKMGLGGAHIHVRTGLETEYLGEEFFDHIKACVDKAKKNKMLTWLYDEDRWPSGMAGGIVTADERFRQRNLLFTTKSNSEAETVAIHTANAVGGRSNNGELLACYDIVLDEEGYLKSWEIVDVDAETKGTKWYAYLETPLPTPWFNNQTYVNTLDKAAIDKFIEVTYEAYKKQVGDEFGKSIPAIFTDEPQFVKKRVLAHPFEKKDITLPWTDDLAKTFADAYGEDLIAGVPELVWNLPNGKISTVRYHYHDHVAERFVQAFADNCGKWCEENGIALTGHLMEEPTLKSQTNALGDAMRSYRSFQLPGIDMLCNYYEYTTAKQAQSAVRQYGREGMMSELYGVTSWNFDFRGHKLQGDWQAALGVTIRVHHLSWVSMKGEAKRDYPASINYQSPWWHKYSYIEDHFARVNTAMTRGKPCVKVAVVHPVESYWLYTGPSEQNASACQQLDDNFTNITEWLLFGSIDFDFISESLLPDQCKEGTAPLSVGDMQYDAVVIPGMHTIRSSTLDRLETFAAAGGKLIFIGDPPRYVDAKTSDRARRLFEKSVCISFDRMSILQVLEEERIVDIRQSNGEYTNNLLHQIRKDGETLWLFIAHGKEPYNKDISVSKKIKITVKGAYKPILYDTITGTTKEVPYKRVGNNTVITETVYDYDALLYKLVPSEEYGKEPMPVKAPETKRIMIDSAVPFTLSEPNALLLDMAEYALDDEEYRSEEELLIADNNCRIRLGWPIRRSAVAQPWTIKEEKIVHKIRLRFAVESEIDYEGAMLALEDAEVADIAFNGQPVDNTVIGWYTDKSIQTVKLPLIKQGNNILELTLPFGKRTNVEWCYLLGDFGVKVTGKRKTITTLPEKLYFDSIVHQGLPFYGGEVHYLVKVVSDVGRMTLRTPHFRGGVISAAIDGKEVGVIALPPYKLELGDLSAGEHELDITLYVPRTNAFGPVHNADEKYSWWGPNSWRTQGDYWTYEYRLMPQGILSTPIITETIIK